MPQTDVRNSLVVELNALPKRRLSALLASLSSEERDRVTEFLKVEVKARLPFPAMVALSPWLVERIERGVASGPSLMTTATRSALLELVETLPTKAASRPTPHSNNRSLIGRMFDRQIHQRRVA